MVVEAFFCCVVFCVDVLDAITCKDLVEISVVCCNVDRSVVHGILMGLACVCDIYMPGSRKEECILILY